MKKETKTIKEDSKKVSKRSASKKPLKMVKKRSASKKPVKKTNLKSSPNNKIEDNFLHRPIKLKKMIKKITPEIIIPEKSFIEKKFMRNLSCFLAILSVIFFLILMFVEKTANYNNFFVVSVIFLWYMAYDPFGKKSNNLSYFLTFLTTCIIILFFVVCLIILREFLELSLISFVTVAGVYLLLVACFYVICFLSKLTKTKYLSFRQATFLSAFITIIFLIVLSFSTFFLL